MNAPRELAVRRLGLVPYADAHRLQQELLVERLEERIPDMLLLTEHPAVVTLGRGSSADEAKDVELPVIAIERGGEATFHGPGQLVGYPILLLDEDRRDLHVYLRSLEEVVIRTLADFGLVGTRAAGFTGVWIAGKKVCSVGVAVRRWVTWHGFALNLDVDLAGFKSFRPCGLDPDVMTRMADHLVRVPSMRAVEERVVEHFAVVLGYQRSARIVAHGAGDAPS
jgi:lipoyl(octanoyl) transferase